MPVKSGPKEAARMIQRMGAAGKKLLETIKKSDPKMAELIELNLLNIEDIQHLSLTQLVGLLRDLNLETFGVALRGVDSEVSQKILGSVSTGIRLDIEDGLKVGLKSMNDVELAQTEVLEILKKKIDAGDIVIDPNEKTIP